VMASSNVLGGAITVFTNECGGCAWCYLAGVLLPGAGLLHPRQVANGLVRLSVGVGRDHSCILRLVAGN
jgi:hypothetical protein